MLRIGLSRIDITPEVGGSMDGMMRAHGSTSIHDPITARAIVFDDGETKAAVVSCEIVGVIDEVVENVRPEVEKRTGIPEAAVFLTCSHNHSGPAVMGNCTGRDHKYVAALPGKLIQVIEGAAARMVPARIGIGRGEETTIGYYRRLWNKDGEIVMNWVPVDPGTIVGPAGEPDHEVGVMKIVSADDDDEILATIFHYTIHPNVMSGESFAISSEFPGLSARVIEEKLGGSALFINGAQGSSDIDGLKDRDWAGVERTGRALADAVLKTAGGIREFETDVKVVTGVRHVELPYRKVSDDDVKWAQDVLAASTGEKIVMADGVSDEFVAGVIMNVLPKQGKKLPIELGGLAVGGMAFVSFPCELFTEIGLAIKKGSPFRQTYIMGLTNGCIGYLPATKAVPEGGFSVGIRKMDPPAEKLVTEASLDLLKEMAGKMD